MMGSEIVILVNEEKLLGVHEVIWDGRNSAGQLVAGGVYLYQLTAGGFTTAKTIVRLK